MSPLSRDFADRTGFPGGSRTRIRFCQENANSPATFFEEDWYDTRTSVTDLLRTSVTIQTGLHAVERSGTDGREREICRIGPDRAFYDKIRSWKNAKDVTFRLFPDPYSEYATLSSGKRLTAIPAFSFLQIRPSLRTPLVFATSTAPTPCNRRTGFANGCVAG